jgi:hypothetical protein
MDRENLEAGLREIDGLLERRCAEIRNAAEDAVLSLRNSFHSQLIRLPRKLRATPVSNLFTDEELNAIGYKLKEETGAETVGSKNSALALERAAMKDTARVLTRNAGEKGGASMKEAKTVSAMRQSKARERKSKAHDTAASRTDGPPGAPSEEEVVSEQPDLEAAIRTVLEQLLSKQDVSVTDAAHEITPDLVKLLHERVNMKRT